MNKILASFILVWTVCTVQAQTQSKTVPLSLKDCITRALDQNLNISVEKLNPEMADISVSQAKEKYLPQLSLAMNQRNTNSASFSWLDAADQVETEYQFYTAEMSQLVPTGGSFSVSLETSQNETNRKFQTINPRYGSTLTFDFVHPLLRNFGFTVNNRDIILARNNANISESRFKSVVLETIYSVESAYWNLVFSIENLKARQQSLELAKDLLERNKRSVEIGRLAPIDLQSAVAEVATREADILEAEALVQNNQDLLKTLINLQTEDLQSDITITPLDKPLVEEENISLQKALELARLNRPDLQEIKYDIKNQDLEVKYAKNQLLPDLNLQASYWSPGISGTRLLYQNNDPTTGRVIGTIAGGSNDAFKDAYNFKYENWSVSLSLDIPLNTVFARNQLAESIVSRDQAKLRQQNLEQQLLLEIKTANRSVETNLKRVNAYRIARELTEKKLETEEEKFRLGNSTNYDVFLFQRDLSDARSSELRAIIDYNLSLAYRELVLGTSLETKNVQLEDVRY
jgi:outer membrane protein TolC